MTDLVWPNRPTWLTKEAGQNVDAFKAAVPISLQQTTCRCSRAQFPGWYLNEDRNMWVCASCDKPSPAHQGYNIICMWCENWFTIQKFPVPEGDIEAINAAYKIVQQESCRDCGGENDARILEESLF